jgi:hypothetical protein
MWKLITILSQFYYYVTATLFYKEGPTYLCTDPTTFQDYYTTSSNTTIFSYNEWTPVTYGYCSPYHSYYTAVCSTIPSSSATYPELTRRRKGKRMLSPRLSNRMLPNQTGQYTSKFYQPWVKYDQLCLAFQQPKRKFYKRFRMYKNYTNLTYKK